ncbi:hypothetical protein GCM10010123_40830 [Pilimelia anulata]|uniref:Uncharacterized protein n=1 Tax=Pilimelia anulata TaxID=53371 RepID=A0A8J3BA53_9ACTN|nr:hypothetical protein GCM10010123_40830 [Pilimelia anulata]
MVVGGEFAVAGGQAAPVFAPVEPSFDLVTASVGGLVELRWSTTETAVALPISGLVVGLWDHRTDVLVSSMLPVGP